MYLSKKLPAVPLLKEFQLVYCGTNVACIRFRTTSDPLVL